MLAAMRPGLIRCALGRSCTPLAQRQSDCSLSKLFPGFKVNHRPILTGITAAIGLIKLVNIVNVSDYVEIREQVLNVGHFIRSNTRSVAAVPDFHMAVASDKHFLVKLVFAAP